MVEFLVSKFVWIVLFGIVLMILGLAREKSWVSMYGVCLSFIGVGLHDVIPVLTAFGTVGILLMVFILLVQYWGRSRPEDPS